MGRRLNSGDRVLSLFLWSVCGSRARMARQHACLSLCFSMLFTEQHPSIDCRERRIGLKDHFADLVFGNDAASFVFCCLASLQRPKLDSGEHFSEQYRPIALLPGKGEIMLWIRLFRSNSAISLMLEQATNFCAERQRKASEQHDGDRDQEAD